LEGTPRFLLDNLHSRIKADFEKAKIDYERFRRLYEEDKAVTKNALESQESRYKQLKATLEEARAGAALALRQVDQAKSHLIIAKKDLEDSLVEAPITGYISALFHKPGEMPGSGSSILRIDDLSVLKVSAFLPDQYYPDIQKGMTEMGVVINHINVGELTVTYRSPTIDNRMRNFEIRTLIKDPPDGIAPGAMAKINVIMERKEAVGLPSEAILRRTTGQVVFLAERGRARMIRVETGLEMDGWIEIVSGDIPENSPVITMGQDQLEDGSLISILREDNV
jgi:RND family efflux transporter MFP subunit